MTNELVKILEAAQEHYDTSNMWFNLYQETNDESYWTATEEDVYAARGLLKAYEILTGKKLYPHQIKEELQLMLN